jgi:PST family polysaccharide transporter
MTPIRNLTKQSVSAVKWSAFGNIARYGLQLGAQIVLARLLGPENYGLFALGMLVLTFSNMLADFGFAWGLVQTQNLSEEDVRFVFTWQLISGTIAAVCLYTLSPLAASFFNEPRTESIIHWLSLVCLIQAVSAPSRNLLRRNLDFKWANIIEITSYSIGYIAIGIPLAFYGAGVWSLVAAWITQAFITLILSVIRCPHSVKPLLWYDGASDMFVVGYTVFGTNICNWLLNNFDRILLGRLFNVHTVGLYSVGYNLANTPNSLFIGALQPAFLAAGARIQSEPNRLRNAYLSVLASVWILLLPMFVLLAVIAQDLIVVLYGSDWIATGMVLAILALAMPAYITWAMSTPILWNTGRKHWESLLQLPILFVAGFAFFKLAGQGVVMAAIVAACTLLMRAIVITSAACHQLNISAQDLVGFAIRGVIMASLAAVGGFAGTEFCRIANAPHFYALVGGLFIGSSVLIATPLICPRVLGGPVVQMLGRFSPALYAFLDRRLRSNSTRSYALVISVFIGCSVIIVTPFIYTRLFGVPIIQMLERVSSPLIALLDNRIRSATIKGEVENE